MIIIRLETKKGRISKVAIEDDRLNELIKIVKDEKNKSKEINQDLDYFVKLEVIETFINDFDNFKNMVRNLNNPKITTISAENFNSTEKTIIPLD